MSFKQAPRLPPNLDLLDGVGACLKDTAPTHNVRGNHEKLKSSDKKHRIK